MLWGGALNVTYEPSLTLGTDGSRTEVLLPRDKQCWGINVDENKKKKHHETHGTNSYWLSNVSVCRHAWGTRIITASSNNSAHLQNLMQRDISRLRLVQHFVFTSTGNHYTAAIIILSSQARSDIMVVWYYEQGPVFLSRYPEGEASAGALKSHF